MVFWQYSRRPAEVVFLGDAKIITLVESAHLLGCPSNVGKRRDAQKLPKRRLLKDCRLNHVVGGIQCQKMRQMADDNYFIPYFYVLFLKRQAVNLASHCPPTSSHSIFNIERTTFSGNIFFKKG